MGLELPDLSGMQRIDPSAPSRPAAPPVIPSEPDWNPFQRSSLPTILNTAPDQLRQFYNRASGPQSRVLPQNPAALTSHNSAASSQAIVVQQNGNGLLLQTNGAKNPTQNILNLIAGSGVSIVANSGGGVTISGSGSAGDGLIHGDRIWDIDPAYLALRDDFVAVSSVSGAFTSQLYWIAALDGANVQSQTPPLFGGLLLSNDSVGGDINAIFLGSGNSGGNLDTMSVQNAWPLFDWPSWKLIWIFTVNRPYTQNIADIPAFAWDQVSTYVGLASFYQQGTITDTMSPRPPMFVGLRYDTDTTSPAISDTEFVFEAVCNATDSTSRSDLNVQGNVVPTGIAAVEGTTYRLEILCTAIGTVTMTLYNGVTSFTSPVTIPKYSNTFSVIEVAAAGGLGMVGTINGVGKPFAPGTQIGLSGFTSSASVLNGTQTCIGGNVDFSLFYSSASVAATTYGTNPVVSGYGAVLPFFSFGNDTQSSPTAESKGVNIDFFSFAWNPGVGGGSGTPNVLLPRYF